MNHIIDSVEPGRLQFRPTLLALAIAAMFSPLDALAQASAFEANIDAGLAVVSGDSADRAHFGQYNGLRTKKTEVVLGGDYYRRNDESGTVVQAQGSNVLGSTRDLEVRWMKQGDWKVGATYGQGVRYDPHTVNTGLQVLGGTSPTASVILPGTGADVDLRVKRSALGLSLWKSIVPGWDGELSFKTEHKEGARLFGIGMNCPSTVAITCGGTTGIQTGSAVLMMPEPIDATHSQIDARLSYAGDRLRLSVGYYGSYFTNANGSLNLGIPGSLNNSLGSTLPLSPGLQGLLGQPIALAPDNQAQQIDFTGSFLVTPTTQVRLKLGYGQALQRQDFAAVGLTGAPAGQNNLGAKVVTTSALVGASARPMPKLHLHADVRFEDKDDQTPIAPYNVEGTSSYTNRALSNRRMRSKLQAAYQFSGSYRGSLTFNQESIDRGAFTASSAVSGISALRQKTDENGLSAELRRRMSESVSATVGLTRSQRTGSNWLRDNSGLGVTEIADPNSPGSGLGATAIYMPTLADRQRDALKLRTEWQPTDELAFQLSADTGKDRYKTPSDVGLRDTANSQLSIDTSYALSARWNLTGWYTHARQTLHQVRPAAYILSYTNTSDGLGVGATGKPMSKLNVGAGFSYSNDRSAYAQSLDALASADSVALLAATGGLPDIVFRQTQLKLFGRYELDKPSAVRVDLVHQRTHVADWTWGYNAVPFTYSDGTTLWQKPDQDVTVISVSYSYRWE